MEMRQNTLEIVFEFNEEELVDENVDEKVDAVQCEIDDGLHNNRQSGVRRGEAESHQRKYRQRGGQV